MCNSSYTLQVIQFISTMSNQLLSSNVHGGAVAYVSGSHRMDFIKKPLVATMSEVPLHLSPPVQQISQENFQPIVQEEAIESRCKDVEIQTDYRDSEAQTDPYSPEEIYREGTKPEVLFLKNLTYGHGLPATVDVLDMIEQNRQKIWFENALPPISDEASFNLRRKLMEEQENREWHKKEEEIKKLHNEGLELVRQGIVEREKDITQKNMHRIEEIKIRKTQQKNRLIAKIQRKKIKVLRKLFKSRKGEGQAEADISRNIIEDYADFGSQVYAGISRQGLTLDKLANKYEVQPVALNTFEGLDDIEVQPEKTGKTRERVDQSIQVKQPRLEISHKKALEIAQNAINIKEKPERVEDEDEKDEYIALRNIVARPPTPNWKNNEDMSLQEWKTSLSKQELKEQSNRQKDEIKRKVAVLFLQRILRGRAQQNVMYEGKEKRLALIEELLIVAKIPSLPENETEEILLQEHEENFRNAMYEGLQGEVIAQTLDELSKKLLRITQEKKIRRKVEDSENERRQREVQEAGRRNAEEVIRARQQCLYEEIVKMNQGTVDSYLNWIINDTVDRASDRQSSIMANLRKQEMNRHLQTFERRFNKNETLIKDLVQSFLLPNVQRSRLVKKVQLEQARFQEAAKGSLRTTFTKTTNRLYEE